MTQAIADQHAESQWLSCVFAEPRTLIEAPVPLADFYVRRFALIAGAAMAVQARQEPVDHVSIRVELARSGDLARVGGDETLSRLYETLPIVSSAPVLAKEIRRLARLRALNALMQRGMAATVERDDDEVRAVISELARDTGADTDEGSSFINFQELLARGLEGAMERSKGQEPGLRLGTPSIDRDYKPSPGHLVILGGRPNVGKGHRATDVILTPDGWRQMRDLRVGDLAIGVDGAPTRITGVFPRGELDVLRVTFNDGAYVDVDPDHLWSVACDRAVNSHGRWFTATTGEIRERGMGPRLWRVPIVGAVEHSRRELPVDPYLLGVLLGDGALSRRATWHGEDPEIADRVAPLLPDGHSVRRVKPKDRATKWIVLGPSRRKNNVVESLKRLGMIGKRSWEKSIPTEYLTGSIGQRLDLLCGLMDTDGTVAADGRRVQFTTVSTGLRDGVLELIRSLGGVGHVCQRQTRYRYNGERRVGRVSYTITMALPHGMCPFALTRKVERFEKCVRKKPPCRRIVSIEPVGRDEIVCISVEHPSSLYVARDHVVTHNTSLSFAWHIDTARRGIASGIISIDDDDEDYGGRALGAISEVNPARIFNERLTSDVVQRMAKAAALEMGLRIHFNKIRSRKVESVVAAMHYAVRTLGCRWLSIDFLTAIQNGIRGERREKVNDTLAQIAMAADTLRVPVVLLVQLRRPGGENEFAEPHLSSFKETGEIEEHAKGAILLWRKSDKPGEPVLGKNAKVKRTAAGKRFTLVRHQDTGLLVEAEEDRDGAPWEPQDDEGWS